MTGGYIYELEEVRRMPLRGQLGRWRPARPLPFYTLFMLSDRIARVKAAWEVLRGRACAVRWN